MARNKIEYSTLSNGKYRVIQIYSIKTNIKPVGNDSVVIRDKEGYVFLHLDKEGKLTIFPGFECDGATMALDTPDFMRGAIVHDSFYLFMRKGLVDLFYRGLVDKLLYTMCLEDGMLRIRALWVLTAVKLFGKNSALPSNEKEFYE